MTSKLMFPRRHWLKQKGKQLGLLLSLSVTSTVSRASTILSVRVWPAQEYTRVTLELDRPLKFSQNLLSDPPRLFIDLEQLDLASEIRDLVSKVKADDPYIQQVRVGQLRPGVVRIVFDMKEPVKPQLFALEPIGNYKHRLLLDLYPLNPPDPIKGLLDQIAKAPKPPALPISPPAAASPAPASPTSPPTTPSPAPTSRTTEPASNDPLAELIRERELAARSRSEPSKPDAHEGRREPQIIRMVTVALDPGHGGEDPGAVGHAGALEKNVVLSIAMQLRDLISKEPNMRAFLTRDADYFVPLAQRVNKARRVQADLLVSIHADAFVETSARGASVFVLSEKGASSTAARWLAQKENGADLIGGINLKARNNEAARVLLDLSTKSQVRDSTNLGEVVLAQLGDVGRLHKGDVEKAGFAVLKAPDIPSILVETAFISNPEEEARLVDPAYQRRVARAIFTGIRKYFLKYPPPPKARSSV